MTWTYLSTAPASSDKSWIRLRIGDTSSGNQLLQDEEIEAILSEQGNKHIAGAVSAETVAAFFARRVDKTVGKLRLSMSQASDHYFRLADRLRSESAFGAVPYAGGISIADKEVDTSDTDRVDPSFSVGQFDHPGAPTSTE